MRIRSGVARAVAALAGALTVSLIVAGCSAGGTASVDLPDLPTSKLPSATQKSLSSAVSDAMKATGSSGAIVGVWAPWSGSWVDGRGTVSPGSKTPVTADMTFRAGTITRAMTCDVMYALAAKGTIRTTDSVTSLVDGMPKLKDVTLQDLCDGTSGIGSYGAQLRAGWLTNPDREWDPHELVSYGLGTMSDAVPPGVAWSNSDAGYVLLGLALEHASGQSMAALLREHVFSPLGLASTSLPGDAAAPPVVGSSTPLQGWYTAKTAKGGYDCRAQTDITDLSASIGSSDSGVVSDIHDLGTYVHALASGALVKDKKRFAGGLPVYKGAPAWYTAAGGAFQAGPLVGQFGAMPGYLTAAFSDPVSGLTVAVVLNNSTAGASAVVSLAWELAAIASKAPAAEGKRTPASGMPWTAEKYHAAIAASAICS